MPEAEPGIVLVGMPGSGKSTVGRLVAERLGRPFVDTDAIFERLHRTPAPDYLSSHGEAAFREAETAAVAEACRPARSGGRSRGRRDHRSAEPMGAVASRGRRLAGRAGRDPGPPPQERWGPRPTFQPYDASRLSSVNAERAPFYRAADLRLDAAPEPSRVADKLTVLRVRPDGATPVRRGDLRHHPIGPALGRVVMGVDLELGALVPRGVAVADRRAPVNVPGSLPARDHRGGACEAGAPPRKGPRMAGGAACRA